MATMNATVTEITGRELGIVKDGMDEAEVFTFIGSLIDQNSDLADKLEYLNSLTKLAERTVIIAEEQAKSIKMETEKKARAKAATIIARAEEKAKAEAERIIAEAQESAEESAQEKVLLAEQQAQDIIEAAQVIKTAWEEANRIVAEAEQKSMEIIEGARRKAKADASSMITEPRTIWVWDRKQQAWVEIVEKAGVQPQCIKEEAEQLLLASKRLGEEEEGKENLVCSFEVNVSPFID